MYSAALGSLLLLILSHHASANSQSFTREVQLNAELEATDIISKHIPQEHFSVSVVATTKQPNKIDNLYLPEGISPIAPAISGVWKLFTDDFKIQIKISDSYGRKTQNELAEILSTKMSIEKSRIEFRKLNLEVPRSSSQLEQQIMRSEAAERDAKNEAAKLARERDDAVRELNQAKNDHADHKKTASDDKQSADQISTFQWYIIYGAIALLLSVVAICIVFALIGRSIGMTVAKSIATVGEALPILGDKIVTASLGDGVNKDNTVSINPDLPGLVASKDGASSGSYLAGLELDSIQARIGQLHEEITGLITDENEFVILQVVAQLVNSDVTASKAVAALEILGVSRANALYKRLSSSDQDRIRKFMDDGAYTRSKWELMIEAGEDLKTKLIGRKVIGYKGLSMRLSEQLLGCDDHLLEKLLSSMTIDLVPRFVHYIDPEKFGKALRAIKLSRPDRFQDLSIVISQIPKAANQSNLDEQIVTEYKKIQLEGTEDEHRRFFGTYQSIIEALDDDSAEHVTAKLGATSTSVRSFLEENIISFKTLLRLQDEFFEKILDEISNKDIAALLPLLDDNAKAKFSRSLGKRRLDLVSDEAGVLESKTKSEVSDIQQSAKSTVVIKIRQLREQGGLSRYLMTSSTGNLEDQTSASDVKNVA